MLPLGASRGVWHFSTHQRFVPAKILSKGAEKKTNTERLSKANAWREVTMSRPRRAASMGQEYAGAAEEDDVQPLAGMLGFF